MIFSEIESGLTRENNKIAAFKTDVKATKYLYLMAGVHGDEVEGVYVLKELFEWLKTEHTLKDLPIVVIPIVNIDGYRAGTRVNAHQVDLNRNLPTGDWRPDATEKKYYPGPEALSEPENQFLVKLFDKYKPGFILSFHTWKPILNYNGDCEDIAVFLNKYNNYPMDSDIGYPTPGSLGAYGPEKYDCPVLTFECPELKTHRETLKDIWEENEQGLKDLMQSELLTKRIGL